MAVYQFWHFRWTVHWPDSEPSAPMTPAPVSEAPARKGSPLTPIKEEPVEVIDLTCSEEMSPRENLLRRFEECDPTLVID